MSRMNARTKISLVASVCMAFLTVTILTRRRDSPLTSSDSPQIEFKTETEVRKQKGNLPEDWTLGNVITYKDGDWQRINLACDEKPGFVKTYLKFPGNTLIYVHSPKVDKHVSNAIITRGGYEEQWIKKVLGYLKKYPKAVFLDIGANIGVFSLTIAAHGIRVLSIEVLPDNVNRLCASMRGAKQPYKMTIINNAASYQHEKVGVFKYPGDMGGTYIKPEVQKASSVLETVLLDDLLNFYNLEEVVIKMDVEGHEDKVLKGSNNFFKKVKVRALLMEFNKHQYKESGKFINEYLTLNGLVPQVPKNEIKDYNKWKSNNIMFLGKAD